MRLGGSREGLGNSRDLNPVSPLLSGTARKKRRKSPGLQHGETPSSLPKKGRREEARGKERLPVLSHKGFLHFLAGFSTQTCLFKRERNVTDCSGGAGGEGKTKIICSAVRSVSCACVWVRVCL